MAKTHTIQKLARIVGDFVVAHNGVWEHDHWEALCSEIKALGVELDPDLEQRLGMLVETMKIFFFCVPAELPSSKRPKNDLKE